MFCQKFEAKQTKDREKFSEYNLYEIFHQWVLIEGVPKIFNQGFFWVME